METIILKIKRLLKSKKITYEEFANEIGVSKVTVVNWFKGRSNISIAHLKKIASYFGVPVSYFFDEGVGNGVVGDNNVVGSNIKITLAQKDSEIEVLRSKLSGCEDIIKEKERMIAEKDKQIESLRELIEVLKERCR